MLRNVLVLDDEESYRHMLSEMLRREGYEVTTADDVDRALELLKKDSFDVVLSDVRMPKRDGWEFLTAVREKRESAVVIMMSAYGDKDTALNVMKRGAYDYISKPFTTDDILLTLRKAEEREKLRRENVVLREQVLKEYAFENIIAKSSKMLDIFAIIRKIAEYKTTVLITGECGTG
ncbi:MAG: sigma-54-dependent transcriptional regulator, partial [Candidatus Binatia bacterium]